MNGRKGSEKEWKAGKEGKRIWKEGKDERGRKEEKVEGKEEIKGGRKKERVGM